MTTLLALPPALVVSGDRLRDAEAAARLEWFESDGRGGGAAGTAIGAATRREHGLLLVATDASDAAPHLRAARFEERIVTGDDAFEPGVNFYPDAIHPQGHLRLRSFAIDPWPSWRYDLGGATLVRELLVSRAARSTIVRWRLSGAEGTLEVRPLLAARRADELSDPAGLRGDIAFRGRSLVHAPHGLPVLVLSFESAEWSPEPDVYRATTHPRDAGRARGNREDLFTPGTLRLPLARDRWVAIVCGTAPIEAGSVPELVAGELQRREAVAARGRSFSCDDIPRHLPARLALAADAWVVRRGGGRAVMAGFPGLRERTGDALAALPGLCVATGQVHEAAAVLHGFVRRAFARGDASADTKSLLRYVLAAAAVAGQGTAAGEHWPTVRRALETCASRAGPGGFGGPSAAELNELWHAALRCGHAFAPDHPAAARFESMANRLRESPTPPAGYPERAFPVVPSTTGPMLLDPSRLAAAVAAYDDADGGATRSLPAARLDDFARALVRLDGAAAQRRLRELLEHAATVVETRGFGHVPEYLDRSVDERAIADSAAVAALISICALLTSLAPAGVAPAREDGYIARPWTP